MTKVVPLILAGSWKIFMDVNMLKQCSGDCFVRTANISSEVQSKPGRQADDQK